ncbi:MAG: DUF362 domain-containing protein [Candidatus Thermoplasmatota archaeon]|nr:DUF362 domain-containing protein [Candidatus Thermoplasmatota archaeon]
MGEEDRVKKVVHITDLSQLDTALGFFNLQSFVGNEVLFKLHMGEIGNKYYPKPSLVRPVVDHLKSMGMSPFFYDTTVAYPGLRHTKRGYENVAKMHGYTKLGCNVIIDDTGVGVTVEGRTYEVGTTLHASSHLVAFSHVKGHTATGMGGAIKNLGMGGVTKETKRWMHNGSKPIYNEKNCTYCGVCADVCPFDAITVNKKKWKVSKRKCFGCGVCVDNCKQQALTNKDKNLQYLLACSAKACVHQKDVLYINDVNRISRSCDCDPIAGPLVCPDLGFLVADDMVAIDKASLDLVNNAKPDVFQKVNNVDPEKQIKYGEEIGLGSASYTLIEP